MPSSPEGTGEPTELLSHALERAVVLARQDEGRREGPPPPVALRPVLRFTKLPARALQTVYEVLDSDEEFRSRVASSVTEKDVDRASWVFLERPEGWESELRLLGAAADEELADERASRAEQSAIRRAAQLEETVQRLRGERDDAQRAVRAAEQGSAEERRSLRSLEAERDELAQRNSELESARSRAVKELKAAEALAADRLGELRLARERLQELEASMAGGTAGSASDSGPEVPAEPEASPPASIPPDRWQRVDPAAVASAVADAAEAATSLSASLASAAELLGSLADTTGSGSGKRLDGADRTTGAADRPGGPAQRPPRRTPVRLRRGVHEGSSESVEQLLAVPGMVAFVDGYNVSMELWPSLDRTAQRQSLIRSLGSIAARFSATIHVVFDGDDDGSRPAVAAPLPVRVHFSRAEVEADDRILAMVAELPPDVAVMVVSSDRRVAEGARRLGANTVRSSQFIELISR